jgi:hypothetical protein
MHCHEIIIKEEEENRDGTMQIIMGLLAFAASSAVMLKMPAVTKSHQG